MKQLTTAASAAALLLSAGFGGSPLSYGQALYFPPEDFEATWETTDPEAAGYCVAGIDALDSLLEATGSRAFLLLKDGRIVHERYFGTFTRDSLWVWNSAAKSLTAALVGEAVADGLVDVHAPTADYLGSGWTSLTPERELDVTVWHQLTMTTGLDDDVPDPYCTEPACLRYRADVGTRWAYHNGPYTLLLDVVEAATGVGVNAYLNARLLQPTGMRGRFSSVGYNRRFVSRPRDFARFGLLMLAEGTWDGVPVLADTAYLHAMVTPSQGLNPSYGYLWWLNGGPSYVLPRSQRVFDGALAPSLPADAYSALGKAGQIVTVVPSRGEVWVRVGEDPGGAGSFVPSTYYEALAAAIEEARCGTSGTLARRPVERAVRIVRLGERLRVEVPAGTRSVMLVNAAGQTVRERSVEPGAPVTIDVAGLPAGVYVLALPGTGLAPTRMVVR